MSGKHSPLPWYIESLYGKYYGTEILDANHDYVCTIWNHNRDDPEGNRPSVREIAKHGPFDSEKDFDNFWKEYCYDTHYESVSDLANAELIIAAVNALPRA